MFKLQSSLKPTGDQLQAIDKLALGIQKKLKNQVLLGVTGSGKTFTMANVIQKLNMPALLISHNKTLAGQLYQEMRNFFPSNAVSYFVSYYDFYQPEAYMPTTDTYIEKEAQINELIDKLRLQATTNILTRNDVIVVASVSCIYNIGSPVEYGKFIAEIKIGEHADWNRIALRLVELLYERSEFEFKRGTFRIRGSYMDIYPAYEDYGYRLESENNKIHKISKFDPLTGREIFPERHSGKQVKRARPESNNDSGVAYAPQNDKQEPFKQMTKEIVIYPSKHYLMDPVAFQSAEGQIRSDLKKESSELKSLGKTAESERLIRRVNYDLELIKEVGYVSGIENYSRYFDGRKPGDPPNSLIEFFRKAYGDTFITFIDESHMTIPQLRGMYNGDHARKKTLIDFGFRLRAAFDNRPLKFDEFYPKTPHLVYVSATPHEWEVKQSKDVVIEQLVRPTGIVDPKITIRPAKDEVIDLVQEIELRVRGAGKILVTTLTKKIAEDLTDFLKEKNIRASYLHSDIQTLERSDILDSLRKNEFDVLIGVNLLREGLDLPEVSLVAILDADKEGFLRSRTSLIQTMGRAARNVTGEVIMYADQITASMKLAMEEIDRRREYQEEYNIKHHIDPKTIYKPIREKIIEQKTDESYIFLDKTESLTPYDRKKTIKKLETEMKKQAEDLNFELAIKIRDKVKEFKTI